MAAVSSTPLAAGTLGGGRTNWEHTRPTIVRSRSMRASRSHNSPESASRHTHGLSADAQMIQQSSIGDSSDEDDIPLPMAFSAQTRAILEDKQPQKDQEDSRAERDKEIARPLTRSRSSLSRSQSRAGTPSQGSLRISRRSPPPESGNNKTSPPRVVHLSGSKPPNSLRRSASSGDSLANSQREHRASPPRELITPAPVTRTRSALRSRAGSPTSGSEQQSNSRSSGKASVGSAQHASSSGQDTSAERRLGRQDHDSILHERSKPGQDAMTSSIRVRRLPVGSGTFLRGAPMRRGFRRRTGDDEQSPAEDDMGARKSEAEADEDQHDHPVSENGAPQAKQEVAVQDFAQAGGRVREFPDANAQPSSHSRPRSSGSSQRPVKKTVHEPSASPPQRESSGTSSQRKAYERPVFKIPPLLHSQNDQENDPPPTFKRNKPLTSSILGSAENKEKDAQPKNNELHRGQSPSRAPLASLSQNTPHRAPPPPPKMSILNTATTNAGASTLKSKKKRTHVVVNGKMFTLRGRLGKGGSSDVYRVMAENDKIFALKKVNLEDCNEDTVRGYKGEIDLLKQLEDVERVVHLYDWEVNEQKQSLSVLMEMGESDLNKILSHRLQPEDAKLDLSFTRHYWKEMLSCVAAVHSHDIVHSDLKPANFLLVQGRLKLIDFGIANAIDVENTVNVHRETNVGTPNYMSPESLQDTNAGERGPGVAKLMKLGKPSDIWSLGCILYQMTYGKPPFAHIPNQWNRVMAIINPNVTVSYPNEGVGGVYVPSSLRRLLKRCLNRDFTQRPTISQLLDGREAFLNPDAEGDGAVPMTEELLGQILQNVVNRCRDPKRGIPTDVDLKGYPKAFLERIRNSLEKV